MVEGAEEGGAAGEEKSVRGPSFAFAMPSHGTTDGRVPKIVNALCGWLSRMSFEPKQKDYSVLAERLRAEDTENALRNEMRFIRLVY